MGTQCQDIENLRRRVEKLEEAYNKNKKTLKDLRTLSLAETDSIHEIKVALGIEETEEERREKINALKKSFYQ